MNTVLKVENLRKEFGGLVAVKDVSFEIKEGEFVGLIGPNGCGKSTTFNCISGLLNQTSGKVEIYGKDVSNMRPDQIHGLGMTRTFQHTRLWREMTVIENLLVPPRKQLSPNILKSLFKFPQSRQAESLRLEKAHAILEELEVPHMAHNLASELSGGQKQRVAIARALASDPKLILADEPTGALDTTTSYEIMAFLQQLNSEGKTILIVTHEEDIAAMCKRIVRLRDGVIMEDKKVTQVIAESHV